jgi:hypothetical protein
METAKVSENKNVQSQMNLKTPESVPIYYQCLSHEPVMSKTSCDDVIPPKLFPSVSSNVQNFSKCNEISERNVNDPCSDDVNFNSQKSTSIIPCPNPIQVSFSSSPDAKEVVQIVQSCNSEFSNPAEIF